MFTHVLPYSLILTYFQQVWTIFNHIHSLNPIYWCLPHFIRFTLLWNFEMPWTTAKEKYLSARKNLFGFMMILRDSVYISYFCVIFNKMKLIHCFLHKQGSSENDGISDVHDYSEFKVLSNCCYTNCCYPNCICTNCSQSMWIYLKLTKFT